MLFFDVRLFFIDAYSVINAIMRVLTFRYLCLSVVIVSVIVAIFISVGIVTAFMIARPLENPACVDRRK